MRYTVVHVGWTWAVERGRIPLLSRHLSHAGRYPPDAVWNPSFMSIGFRHWWNCWWGREGVLNFSSSCHRRSFLSENRFQISVHVQTFKHFDTRPLTPSSFRLGRCTVFMKMQLVLLSWNCSCWSTSVNVVIAGGVNPPVLVYRRLFLSENRFQISIPVGLPNFKHFDMTDLSVLLDWFQHWLQSSLRCIRPCHWFYNNQ